MRAASCHPDRKYEAHGLCRSCYTREYARRPDQIRKARERYLKQPEAWRKKHLRRRFGITPEQYDRTLARQGGVCAICGAPPQPNRRLAVDHCHESSRVRGLVCYRCNKFRIGRALDSEAALYHKISLYLADGFDGRAA